MNTYTIWALMTTGEYRKLRSFEDEKLAEKYMNYVKYYLEIYGDNGVHELAIKIDGQPAYQLYYMDEENNPRIVDDAEIYFNLDDALDEINELMTDNQDTIYDYNEINIEEDDVEILEIYGL